MASRPWLYGAGAQAVDRTPLTSAAPMVRSTEPINDEALAGHAQRALTAAGYDAVTVLTGNGTLGPTGSGHRMTGSCAPPACSACPRLGCRRPGRADGSSPPGPTRTSMGGCCRCSHSMTALPPGGSSARRGSCGFVTSGHLGFRLAVLSGTTSALRSRRPRCTPSRWPGTMTRSWPSACACPTAGTCTGPRTTMTIMARCGWSTRARGPGRACGTTHAPTAPTKYTSTGRGACRTRSKPPTGGGARLVTPQLLTGVSPSPSTPSESS